MKRILKLILLIFPVLCTLVQAFSVPGTAWHVKEKKAGIVFYQKKHPVVALVLSGGGSRGFAHIGVIKALEQEGILPEIVVGTSMGSVVGGMYAAGLSPDELSKMATMLDWDNIFSDTPPRSDKFYTQKKDQENHIFEFRLSGGKIVLPTALTSGQLITSLIVEKTLAADYEAGFNFDCLPKRFRAMATDLLTAQSVVIRDGCLAEAIRASLAVPFVFSPFRINNRILVDGGFTNILPMDVALSMGADMVVAVHVRPVLYTEAEMNNPVAFIDQVVSICLTNQDKRSVRDSGIIITPSLGRHMPQDFKGIPELIAAGEKAIYDNFGLIRERLDRLADEPLRRDSLTLQSVRLEALVNAPPQPLYALFNPLLGRRIAQQELEKAVEDVYSTGFFDSVNMELQPTPAGSSVVLHLKENRPVTRIDFSGNTLFSGERLRDVFTQKQGEPLSVVALREGKGAIRSLYADSGFALAHVDTILVTEAGCEVIIHEGRIGSIEFIGNEKTRQSVLQREMGLLRGRLFSIRQMQKDVRNLYATGLFEQVYLNLKQQKETGDSLSLVVNVKERPFEAFQLGIRFDNIRMLEGFLGFKGMNFAGRGYVFNSLIQYGMQREKYLLGVRTDRLLHTYLTADAKVFYYRDRKYVVDPLDSTRFEFNALRKIGTMASVAHQISKIGKLSYLFLLEHYKSNRGDDALGPLNNYDKGVRIFSLRTEFDTYDNPAFPSKGYNLFSAWDIGLDVIGKHNAFSEFTLTGSSAFTLFKGQVLMPTLYLSMADVRLPDAVQNYLGGATELRMNDKIVFYNSFPLYGFEEQSFTGDYLMALRLAYRFHVAHSAYFTLLANMGRTWATENFHWSNLKEELLNGSYKGAGIMLSFDVPRVGPIAFTAASPIFSSDKKQSENTLKQFYLSIGHDF